MSQTKHVVLTNVKDNYIGKMVAIHEASHAVMMYLCFGNSCIQCITINAMYHASVDLKPFYCGRVFDLIRLRTAVAGFLAETLYGAGSRDIADWIRNSEERAKDDRKLLAAIMQDNGLEDNYLLLVKIKVRRCLDLPYIKQVTCDLADLLYERLYQTIPSKKKRVEGKIVQQCISESFAKCAEDSSRTVNQLVSRARCFVQMKPVVGATWACALNFSPPT